MSALGTSHAGWSMADGAAWLHGGWCCLAGWCMTLLRYMGLVQEEWGLWMEPTADPNVMGRGMEEVNASNRRCFTSGNFQFHKVIAQ
mmetsp:Transcript_99247/g.145150  ORF Transcript_99247/g.145150 Transcript_99247/m.145150 type:complete len:87 (+) Transcript_99247:11-271(+)